MLDGPECPAGLVSGSPAWGGSLLPLSLGPYGKLPAFNISKKFGVVAGWEIWVASNTLWGRGKVGQEARLTVCEETGRRGGKGQAGHVQQGSPMWVSLHKSTSGSLGRGLISGSHLREPSFGNPGGSTGLPGDLRTFL